jgi:hypothetical protein
MTQTSLPNVGEAHGNRHAAFDFPPSLLTEANDLPVGIIVQQAKYANLAR